MTTPDDPTARLAGWAASLTYDDLPPEVIRAGGRGLIDTVAVILAGAVERGPGLVEAALSDLDTGGSTCQVIGRSMRTGPLVAALVNGTAAHVLDFDDTQKHVGGHGSAVIVPAALAAAESVGASGRSLMLAYVAGLEAMGRAGQLLKHEGYKLGWHHTSVTGPIGAAVAAGSLFGLTADQLAVAIGIAASQASGTRQNFGTMTKSFHVGWSAHAGILAAKLAGLGFTANQQVLTAPLGFSALFYGDPSQLVGVEPGRPYEIVSPGLNTKLYPCCAGTHCALDSTYECLESLSDTDIASIERIRIRVHADGLVPLIYDYPTTGLEGKFCLRYVVAAALQDRGLTIGTFDDERVTSGRYAALMDKVEVVVEKDIETRFAEVAVHLTGGRSVSATTENVKGTPERPMTTEDLESKFRMCAEVSIDREPAEKALQLLTNVQSVEDVGTLTALLAGAN